MLRKKKELCGHRPKEKGMVWIRQTEQEEEPEMQESPNSYRFDDQIF